MYPLPRMSKRTQNIEGFQYVTSLDVNMGYCNIRILSAIQDTTKIVTEFGKLGYNHLPMVLCASGGIFQANVDKLIGNI